MKDRTKTKQQLIDELPQMRQRVVELEAANAEHSPTEKTLQVQRDKFEGIVASLGDGLDIVSQDYRVHFQNELLRERFGDLTGKLCYEEYMGRETPCEPCPMVKAIATGRTQRLELTGADGRDYEVTSTPFQDIDGETKVIEVVRDITERKQVERETEERWQYVEGILAAAADAIVTLDSQHRIVEWNPGAESLFGYKREEVIGQDIEELVTNPDVRGEAIEFTQAALRGDNVPSVETIRYRKDGSAVDVIVAGSPILLENELIGAVAVYTEITERKKAEQEIRRLNQYLESVIDNANVWLDVAGEDGNIILWNKAAEAISGYSREEVVGHGKMWAWLYPDKRYREVITERVATTIKNGEVRQNLETTIQCKDGQAKIIAWDTRGLADEKGNPVGLIAVGRDITDQKRTEKALEISEHFLGIANRHTEMIALLNEFVAECKDFTGCDAVGIRILDEEGNIPYEAYEGFSQSFYESESPLSVKSDQCMCIDVIKGKTDSKLPFYTEAGSFFMNGTTRFLATVSEEEKGQTRNVCNQYGYESVALIPIRVGDDILGVIHFADPQENMVPLEKVEVMEEAAMQLGMALRRVQAGEILRRTLESTIQAIGLTTEMRDPYTTGHQRRVTQLTCAIAKEMGLSQEQLGGIRAAGLVHDIGKMSIPAEILSKPTKLTEMEFRLVQGHPQVAHNILKTIEFPWPVTQIVLQHHERMDGSGYPQGLKAGAIILEARILAVADVVEAMASFRPYRPALGIDKALEEIVQNKGILYDPKVVDACIRLFTEKKFQFED